MQRFTIASGRFVIGAANKHEDLVRTGNWSGESSGSVTKWTVGTFPTPVRGWPLR